MKRGLKILFILSLLILFVMISKSSYAAISISPAKAELNFQPGAEFSIDYSVSTEPDKKIKIYSIGDFEDTVTFDKTELNGGGSFKASVKLPETASKPGVNRLYIRAEQVVPEGSGLGTSLAVGALIAIRVPYPGRYLEASMITSDANTGERIKIQTDVSNLGTEDIDATGNLDIKAGEEIVKSIPMGTKLIKPTEKEKFEIYLNTSSLAPGTYTAFATISYFDKQAEANSTFRIGSLFVNITNWTQTFIVGQITEFGVVVKSEWNEDLENVFGDITVSKGGQNITSFRTPSIQLKKWESGLLKGYLDAAGIKEGKYDTEIKIFYGGMSTLVKTEITGEKQKNVLITAIIAGGIILVAIAATVGVIWYAKKKKKRK